MTQNGQAPASAREPLSAAGVLAAPLAARPDAEAVVARSGRLTYRQLDELAARGCAALGALGVGPGDRVAVSLPNDLALVGAFYAVMRLGAVFVGVNRQLAPPEKHYILGDCGAAVFLGDPEMVEQVGRRAGELAGLRLVPAGPEAAGEWEQRLAAAATEAVAPPDPLAPAGIAYTSGTTGFPKGAVHSQHNMMLPGAVVVAARRYDPGLRKADCFPFTILNLQMLSSLLVAQAQGTAIVMDRVDPAGIAQWIAAEGATVFNGAPAMLFGLATNDQVAAGDLASLAEVWSGGSHCPPAVIERFEAKFGRPVTTTYGLTEAPSLVAITAAGDRSHHHTSGRPLPHLQVGIVGQDGRPLPTGQRGEITVGAVTEGPWAGAYRPMLGYWRRPEPTGRALAGGVLHTGDIGALDDQGYLVVEDRQSSVILRGGANVYPAEVERVLADHPAVADSCVVGVDDERLGQRVVAMVEPVAGTQPDPEDLGRHCLEQLARYKVPERFVLGELPRNSMGKVRRTDVGQALQDGARRRPLPQRRTV